MTEQDITPFQVVYNLAIKEACLTSLKDVQEEASKQTSITDGLREKIANWKKKWGFELSELEILNKINTDKLFATMFAKDPTRQSIAEKAMLQYLNTNGISALKPKYHIRIDADGSLVMDTRRLDTSSKSVDFVFNTHYIFAKYTEIEGGAQDNQYNDILRTIDRVKLYCQHRQDIRWIFLVEGDYYKKRVEKLKKYATNSLIYVFHCHEYISFIKSTGIGQFYSDNPEILDERFVPFINDGDTIVEPFVGSGSLVHWIQKHTIGKHIAFETYDVDPHYDGAVVRDTLLEPPDYTGKIVITNPPYLAKNMVKRGDPKYDYVRRVCEKYKANDLYKCALISIENCKEFVIILPVNFLCGDDTDVVRLRKRVFSKFGLVCARTFNTGMFDRTTYNICVIRCRSLMAIESLLLPTTLPMVRWNISTPDGDVDIDVDTQHFTIGYELKHPPIPRQLQQLIVVERAIGSPSAGSSGRRQKTSLFQTSLHLTALDTRTRHLVLDYNPKVPTFWGKISDRMRATILTNVVLDDVQQRYLATNWNYIVESGRKKYADLWLSTYRDGGRKRISFEVAFNLIRYCMVLFFYR